MSGLLKYVLILVVAYFAIGWIRRLMQSSPKKPKDKDGEVRIIKKKKDEEARYTMDAETVEYEEID